MDKLINLGLSDSDILKSMHSYFMFGGKGFFYKMLLDSDWSKERYLEAEKSSGMKEGRVKDFEDYFDKAKYLRKEGRMVDGPF